ncbi:class E sortase [Streptomyces longispororuber]|uniref:Class E sortase n=1 Tax=Streptomyces longispororuber TaxID=68230 RepID=A0A918ZFX0_9ACTN|nr:class E sortase [Streptomyces longispororuber]GHE49307.1 class E sortase [Streptomyces longispororuber]
MTAEARGGADAGGTGEHSSPWFRTAPASPPPRSVPSPGAPGNAEAVDPAPPVGPAEPVRRADDETIGLRTADTRRIAAGGRPTAPGRQPLPQEVPVGQGPDVVPGGGRAARRKAAKHKGSRGAQPRPRAVAPSPADGGPGRPLTRLEARRAERARRPSPATVASRVIGELFITVGVLMLLFVTYQLWWTNIRAQQQADAARRDLEEDWARGKGRPGVFEPGQGFALLHIPKLDVVVPVAEGIDKHRVLDRGMVGHYNKGRTKTPMPDADPGNFGVAGHRNTHGEPFRYINRLDPGDPIVVETQDTYYVYKMASILPQTSPANTAVLDAVPPGSGFTKPGRYITLTTCTPEFTSKYRMIVWGKMVEDRPRAKGKPAALVD